MEVRIRATEASAHFEDLMRRVTERQEAVVVERGGDPDVVVLSTAEYERLRAGKRTTWLERADRLREAIRADLDGRELPPPEEVIRQMREERDEQLLREWYRQSADIDWQ